MRKDQQSLCEGCCADRVKEQIENSFGYTHSYFVLTDVEQSFRINNKQTKCAAPIIAEIKGEIKFVVETTSKTHDLQDKNFTVLIMFTFPMWFYVWSD